MRKNQNKKTPRTTTYESYVPPELHSLILARLPVKSLLKFRCVCKTWCSLIDSSAFISMHLNLFKNNRQKTHFLSIEYLGRPRNYDCSISIRRSDTLRKTVQLFNVPRTKKLRLLGSCNGLFLLNDCNRQLRLWNPSIRKTLLLPSPPKPSINFASMYVLGFSPSTADYKVVVFQTPSPRPCTLSVAVYSLGDNLWKVSSYPELSFPQNDLWNDDKTIIYSKGAAFWLIGNPYESGDWGEMTHAASYNFDDEKLTYIELPGFDKAPTTRKCLFLLGDCLAFFSVSSKRRCVWLMKKDGVTESWSLWLSGDSCQDAYCEFQCNMSDISRLKTFYVENGGTSFIYGKRSYEFSTQEWKQLGKSMSCFYTMETYLESLVLSKGCDGLTFVDFP